MRRLLLIGTLLAASACSRKVVVTTPTNPSATATSVRVTNNATQSVTVYVQATGGSEFPVGTVAANSTSLLTVNGVASGATVRLRAALADGSRSYTRDNVTLSGTVDWRVP